VPLQDLASAVAVPAEQLDAILWGLSAELAWAIQVRDGIVHFPPVPRSHPSLDSSPSAASIEEKELVQLARVAQDLDAGLAASARYQTASSKKAGRSTAGAGGGGVGRTRGGGRSSAGLGPVGVEDIF
jgi:hypothetical protein